MNEEEELRKFFIEVDSLLSLLVHRHANYLEEIKEKDIAIKLYTQARRYYEKSEINQCKFTKEDEELLEKLYRVFDTERVEEKSSERDIFKKKMKYFAAIFLINNVLEKR